MSGLDPMHFAVTVGAGRDRPQGRRIVLAPNSSVEVLRAALEGLPATDESWWSPHAWQDDYRRQPDWVAASAIPLDLDYHNEQGQHVHAPAEVRGQLEAALDGFPVNIVHPTPRGWRLITVPDRVITDRKTFERAATALAERVHARLKELGLAAQTRKVQRDDRTVERPCEGVNVDSAVVCDTARFFYSPRARVGGVDRVGELRVISETLYRLRDLTQPERCSEHGRTDASRREDLPFRAISKAAAAYNNDHPQHWPVSGGTCPTCGHNDCFGTHPDNPLRWTCFSASHASDSKGCGRCKSGCWSGDAADLVAHAAGVTRVELLKREGYLHPDSGRRGDRERGSTEPLHAWDLHAGTFRLLGWPDNKRALFVTLEFVREGIPRHRDNIDLNSAKARKRFATAAMDSVPDPLGSTRETLEHDLLELIQLVGEVADTGTSDGAPRGGSTSVADLLVDLASEAELFHDADDRAYARTYVGDHSENWPLRQKKFRTWLAGRYYAQYGHVANAQALQDAIGALEGRACFEGETRQVFARIASVDDAIYVDLGTEDWATVRIDAEGWEVVQDPPVIFIRPKGLMPLPKPVRGGSLSELRRFVNVRDDRDWILYQAWLVCALRYGRPSLIMIVFGEQGSAKTTGQRVGRRLVDPNKAELRSPPRNEHDLVIACRNGWCLGYDNFSRLPVWMSDALCRIATGGGFGTRTLYSDDEEELFDGLRPIMINGIEEVATRGDLLDRAILLYFRGIPEEDRRDENQFWGEFEGAQPRILGALYTAVSVALRRLNDVTLARLPRMADAARWIVAAEPALDCKPGDFLKAYAANRDTVHENVLESSVLGQAIVIWTSKLSSRWEGTATELLADLNEAFDEVTKKAKEWPKTPSHLSGALTRIAPSLRGVGIGIEMAQESGADSRKLIRIRPKNGDAGDAGDANGPEDHPDPAGGVGGVGGVGDLGWRSASEGGELPSDDMAEGVEP